MLRHPLEEPYGFTVSPAVEAVPPARRRVVERARQLGVVVDEQLMADVALLAVEGIANAVTHTKASCLVCVRWTGERLRVEVTDADPSIPCQSQFGPEAESGRGLVLVAALANAWGTRQGSTGQGKTTWFEVVARGAVSSDTGPAVALPGAATRTGGAAAGRTDRSGSAHFEWAPVPIPGRGEQRHHEAA